MYRKCAFLAALALLLILAGGAAAQQEEEKPSVFLLAFGAQDAGRVIQDGMLDALQAYGLITPEDRSQARMPLVLESAENSPVFFRRLQADFQIDRLREMVAAALDQKPDVLVTVSTPLTQAALQATHDMEDPPAIFFADVYNPYESGIADASCIKPNHVTGVESVNNYPEILSLLLLQDPDMQTIGTIHSSADASGIYGARQIAELGESLGLTVEQSAVVSLADLALAAEGLVSKGVEAILLPMDYTTTAGLPLIATIANENGIPLFYASVDGLFRGAALGAGFYQYFAQGNNIGAMIAAYLRGELDIARAGISAQAGETIIGINMIVEEEQDYSFSEALQERADFAVALDDQGRPRVNVRSEKFIAEAMKVYSPEPEPLAAREERDHAFLAGLECTAERIAEQQAELDAMSN